MIGQWIYILGWAYLLGIMSSAPVGPVNLLAIHRGVVGRWTHALACGVGSAAVDTLAFALVLWGGQTVLEEFNTPWLHDAMAIGGAIVLLPLGTIFLLHAWRYSLRDVVRHRRKYRNQPAGRLWRNILTGMALVAINPAVIIFWAGPGSMWLAVARKTIGPAGAWWALPVATAGMMSWFLFLSLILRSMPDRLGPKFFQIVNGICGGILLLFGTLAVGNVILRHP